MVAETATSAVLSLVVATTIGCASYGQTKMENDCAKSSNTDPSPHLSEFDIGFHIVFGIDK